MADEQQLNVENALTGNEPAQAQGEVVQGDNQQEEIKQPEESETKEVPEATQSVEERKEEVPSWAFNKMSKKIKTEVERAVTGAMHTILQMQYSQPQQVTQQQVTQQPQYNPPQPQVQGGVAPEAIQTGISNYFAQQAQQQLLQKEADKAKSFNEQVEAARDKFDDYEEFRREAEPHFTQPMFALMAEVPNSVENFKLAWDEDRSRIMNIAKLSPALQIAELKRVLDNVETNKAAQKYKPTASKPISPVRSTSTNVVKDNNSFADLVRSRYRRPGK